jgi:hypothetical protein
MTDEQIIAELVEGWALWRDTADWKRLLSVWHPGGRIVTTWYTGSAEAFVERSMKAWAAGVMAHHLQSGTVTDVIGTRAIAQTRMTLCLRSAIDGIECDVECIGRFYDFFEKRDGRWGLVFRQPIYEKDRLIVVDPSKSVTLDQDILQRFPAGYRHLAYLQVLAGMTVSDDLPGMRGEIVEQLYQSGKRWLAGGDLDR